jgi:preprotein translocase subunit SecA
VRPPSSPIGTVFVAFAIIIRRDIGAKCITLFAKETTPAMVGAGLLRAVFGTSKDRDYKRLKPYMTAVNALEPRFAAMTNTQLRAQTEVFKQRLSEGETLEDLLPEAFAVVREASKRVVGMRPFDVQMRRRRRAAQGNIAEMVTGEGKTLVATMPLYLNALRWTGVHLVTVNDYLARRDSEWMGAIFEFLGMTVGIDSARYGHGRTPGALPRRHHLWHQQRIRLRLPRDNMASARKCACSANSTYAIVDEIDSILIDEARTPLIISGRPEKATDILLQGRRRGTEAERKATTRSRKRETMCHLQKMA